jgi:hypothetical protein
MYVSTFSQKVGNKHCGCYTKSVYLDYMNTETKLAVERAFASSSAELFGILPIADGEGRGAIPEVEIKYEKFGAKASEIAENYFNLTSIVEDAKPLAVAEFDYDEFVEKFKRAM